MPGPRKERRKKNFSQDERAIVVSAMERYDSRLHGADSGSTSKTKKEEILRKVTAQVNALGHEARTPQEILKKMNDLRGVVRNKMAIIAKHARGTGGGPPCSTRLTEEEEVIARCLRREQVEGLEGHDSSEPPMRTGKCVLSSIWCVACVVGVVGYVTSVWVHQHVNVLCHPQVSRMKRGHPMLPVAVTDHHPLSSLLL